MIPTTIPSTAPTIDLPIIHDDTSLISTDTHTISPVVPTIPLIAPTISTLPHSFALTHLIILPTSPSLPYQLAILVSPRQPILVGRPYRTQSNGFTSDDSSRDSLSDSSSETSSDSHSDSSSDSPSRHSSSGYAISNSPCDSPTATSKRPSRKRCRSPSVPVSLPVYVDLSPIRVDLSPPHKRIRDSNLVTDLEVSSEDGYELYVPSEVSLGVDVEDSYEPYTEPNVDSVVQTYINDCIMYADAIRARWVDNRDVVETLAAEEVESSARGTIRVEVDPRVRLVIDFDVRESVRVDVPDHVIADGAVEVTYETLGDLVQRFHDHAIEIQVTKFRTMSTATRTKMTQDAINELITKRADEALKIYDDARIPEIEAEIKNEQQEDHVEGDVNNGNCNGNGNGNPNVNNE
ncbi:hypothetical protein Tco_0091440, partial [Tanacetum coccineum]